MWCFAIDTPYWPLIWHDLFLVPGFTPSFPRVAFVSGGSNKCQTERSTTLGGDLGHDGKDVVAGI